LNFTDGDIRRSIAKFEETNEIDAYKIMTSDFKYVSIDTKAIDALEIMKYN
jgi:hypothetical protein